MKKLVCFAAFFLAGSIAFGQEAKSKDEQDTLRPNAEIAIAQDSMVETKATLVKKPKLEKELFGIYYDNAFPLGYGSVVRQQLSSEVFQFISAYSAILFTYERQLGEKFTLRGEVGIGVNASIFLPAKVDNWDIGAAVDARISPTLSIEPRFYYYLFPTEKMTIVTLFGPMTFSYSKNSGNFLAINLKLIAPWGYDILSNQMNTGLTILFIAPKWGSRSVWFNGLTLEFGVSAGYEGVFVPDGRNFHLFAVRLDLTIGAMF